MKSVFFTRAFIVLFIENFLFFTSHAALNTLPAYLEKLGASKAYIGFFMNVNPMLLVAAVLFFWKILAKIPVKTQLVTGLLLQMVSYALMFLYHDNLALLLVFRFTAAFSFIAGFMNNMSLAYNIVPQSKRAGGIALFGISGMLSNPVASALGEIILKNSEPRFLFMLGAAFCLAALVSVFFLVDGNGERETARGFLAVSGRRGVPALLAVSFVFGGAWSVFAAFLPNLTEAKFGSVMVSAYYMGFLGVAVISRFIFSGFMDRLPLRALTSIPLLFITVSLLLVLGVNSPWQLTLIGVMYGAGHSILYPVLSAAVVGCGPASEKTSLNNAFIAANTFGNVAISTGLGVVGDFFKLPAIFITMAALVLCALAVSLFLLRKGSLSGAKERIVE